MNEHLSKSKARHRVMAGEKHTGTGPMGGALQMDFVWVLQMRSHQRE